MKSVLKNLLLKEPLLVQTGAIFLTGFCVRLIYLYLKDTRGGYDTLDYLALADNLYNFGAYSLNDFPNLAPTLRRAPGYPVFLAFFQWLGSGHLSFQSVAFIQGALDALTAAAIFRLAHKVAAPPLAFAAAAFYIFHPGAIFQSRLLLTECLFTFLLVVGVLMLIEALEKERIWLLILAGLLLGSGVLTRPLAIVLPVLIAITVWRKFDSKKKYKFIAIFGAVFLFTLLPWLFRCYQVAGQFVFVQGVSAFQFYAPTRIDLPQWDEQKLWRDFFDPQTSDEYFRRLARAETPVDFIEAEKIGRAKAFENIRNHPREYLISRGKAYPHFFITSFDNFTGINKSYGTLLAEKNIFNLSIKILLVLVFSLLPFVLSLIGLRRGAQNPTSFLCALIWISILLIHLPMWIEHRFWMPFVPFQIITAAGGLAVLQERLRALKSVKN